jgi:hypothetical protein
MLKNESTAYRFCWAWQAGWRAGFRADGLESATGMCILWLKAAKTVLHGVHSKTQEMAAVKSDTSVYALGFSLGLELYRDAKSPRASVIITV